MTTENIFPVIKKFLYSDHDIFLREVVANAVDATQKLKALAGTGEFKGELGDLTIRVDVDNKAKTIKIIIGHFGLGFYSAFMVSQKVRIETLSWKEGAKAVKWECLGEPDFTMTECKREDRGTTITLFLDADSEEFAEEAKIGALTAADLGIDDAAKAPKIEYVSFINPPKKQAGEKIKEDDVEVAVAKAMEKLIAAKIL